MVLSNETVFSRRSANYTRLIIKDTNVEVQPPQTVNLTDYRKKMNWIKDFRSCGLHHYPIVNLECRHYGLFFHKIFFLV